MSDGRSMFKNTLHMPLSKAGLGAFDEEKFKKVLNDQELMV
jgi:hypothetical protein